jgi:hypothetical protein
MTPSEFAEAIRFRFLGSQSSLKALRRCQNLVSKFGLPFEPAAALELLNTVLPGDRKESRPRLKELCRIPRMSTIAVAAIIDKAVSAMPPQTCFVNVGVWHGFTFLAGLVNNPNLPAIGVDDFSQFRNLCSKAPRDGFLERFRTYRSACHEFHEMDYREYFSRAHRQQIGFYIYDAEHSYANQLTGLKIAEPFFAAGCLIMIDDTNLPEARQATLDFMKDSPNRYRIVFDRSTEENGHPTFWNGVMLLERC